jgi:hypothetical protein
MKSPNTKGIYHDRAKRDERKRITYTIVTTLTLMNCILNDAGHNMVQYTTE